jgi:hypothetical protein
MIIKFTLHTGEEIELGPIKPKEDFKETYISRGEEKSYIDTHKYQNQFQKFENKILKNLHSDIVEDYAKFTFDLIDEDSCDCSDDEKDIHDFSDEEVSEQFYHNMKLKLSIVNKSQLDRFYKVLEKASPEDIESFLKEQETKNKIV